VVIGKDAFRNKQKMTRNVTKVILIVLTLTLVILAGFSPVNEKVLETQNMAFEIGFKQVDRVEVLEKFFEKFNSPLAENSETFVRVADEYGIDYTLLPSIACQESTCAKFLIEGTYNPFGWGIYGDNYISFDSYDDAIEGVGKGLNDGYFAKGYDTLAEIAPIYTPPSNGSWYRGVNWFSSQIGDIALAI
jgi:hypothetical protein